MSEFPVHEFEFDDELSDVPKDVILNKSRLGVEVDQFFDNMFKTRINYTEKDNGYSIYDLVPNPDYFERVYKGSLRHFRRDSFYSHAASTIKNSSKQSVVKVNEADDWIRAFFMHPDMFKGKDFLLEQVKVREGLNSGYSQVEQTEILQLTKDQVQAFKDNGWGFNIDITLPLTSRTWTTNMSMPSECTTRVRRFFPKRFKSFRIGHIQPAVNFPPMTAKYLYERFTEHIKDRPIKIYDPSSGWGGRILGACAVRDDRTIHYIVTPTPILIIFILMWILDILMSQIFITPRPTDQTRSSQAQTPTKSSN